MLGIAAYSHAVIGKEMFILFNNNNKEKLRDFKYSSLCDILVKGSKSLIKNQGCPFPKLVFFQWQEDSQGKGLPALGSIPHSVPCTSGQGAYDFKFIVDK